MAKEEIISIMRNFKDAYNKKDLEESLSFFAEDADWVNPDGVFKGKEKIKSYLKWAFEIIPDHKIIESGVKIIAEEDRAVYEHILEGSYEGMKYQILALCIYEFKGDKIKHVRSAYDRLSLAKQVAKGPIAKTAVNSIIKQMEKGLHA
jgi:ketosteroid isomerase-like protein